MNTETVFFPHSGDVTEAHSWVTLEGVRQCIGVLAGCRFCEEHQKWIAAMMQASALYLELATLRE